MINSKKIILLAGDPNSINSEIIFKSWNKLSSNLKKKVYIIGNLKLLKKQFNLLNTRIVAKEVKHLNENTEITNLKIINVDLNFKNPFKVSKKEASKYVLKSLILGHKLAIRKDVKGIINCAISKELLLKKNTGVTEFLAKRCKIIKNSEVMMIKSKNFSICPITTHISLKKVSKSIKTKLLILKIKTIQECYKKLFLKKPKIGVLGLNPHNDELRKDSEEIKYIIPAIKILRKKGLRINGPLVSDTIFIKDYKNYDVIVGMYHDQVLSPFKSIFKFDAINLTLGLKYLRVSPDHGVAHNLIKKNKANPSSLLRCINFINKFGK